MELIKYTVIEKTDDGFKPKFHEAEFKLKSGVFTASYDGKHIIFKDGVKPSTAKEELFVAEKLIGDWKAKKALLEVAKENFINMDVNPSDFMKK